LLITFKLLKHGSVNVELYFFTEMWFSESPHLQLKTNPVSNSFLQRGQIGNSGLNYLFNASLPDSKIVAVALAGY